MAEPLRHTHSDDSTERLSALLDDILTGPELQQAQQLVNACPACRIELAELRTMQAWLHDLPPITPPHSFTLDPAHYHTTAGNRWFGLLRWAGALAILLLFVGLGAAVLRSNGGAATTSLSLPSTASGGAATGSQPMVAAGAATSAALAQESSGGGAAATMAAAAVAPAQQAPASGAALSTGATSAATAARAADASGAQPPALPQGDNAATTLALVPPSSPAANSAQRTLPLAITPTGEQLPTAPPLTRMTETPGLSAKATAPAPPPGGLGRGWIYGGLLALLILAGLAILLNRRRIRG